MNRLFQRIDISSLVFFRIAFGILALAETLSLWLYFHLTTRSFEPENFQFKYFGFEWARPLPEPFMTIFFVVMLLASVGVILGKWYRVSALVFAMAFTYSFLLEKAHYLNHGYFFCWISFVMVFLPANRGWSLDVRKNPALHMRSIPFWSMAILPFLMGVVYFYGGIAKINADWLQAVPLKTWLGRREDMPVLGWLLAKEGTAWFMCYGGLLLDLTIAFLLLSRKTRLFALGAAVFFHISNSLIFNIGIFPWLSLVLTLMYFPPDLPRRWVSGLRKRLRIVERWASGWEKRLEGVAEAESWHSLPRFRPWIKGALLLLIAFHMLYPLRHHLLEGPVAWTEEGHRFSWRMMLRSKNGYGHFEIVDPATGRKERVKPADYLSKKQSRKLFTHPDMILQFAHFLRDEWCDKGVDDVQVYAIVKTQLNGRPYQHFVDPAVDLAAQRWSQWKESPWILPMEKPATPGSE